MSFQTVSDLKKLPSLSKEKATTKPIKVKVIVDPVYHHDDINPTTPKVTVMSIVADDSGTIKCHI